MVLSNYKVGAGLAVSDMGRAREFYEGKLGLTVSIDSPDNVQYRCAQNSVLHIYLSPEHAGKSTATLASWGVDDIERVVDELTKRGVTFEHYDEPGLKTDEKGIATFEGDAKVAYFKDPDGHTLQPGPDAHDAPLTPAGPGRGHGSVPCLRSSRHHHRHVRQRHQRDVPQLDGQ
jgi:catechol 2,3-dioxygenase-like lactoylglutathione lyase family enzyme